MVILSSHAMHDFQELRVAGTRAREPLKRRSHIKYRPDGVVEGFLRELNLDVLSIHPGYGFCVELRFSCGGRLGVGLNVCFIQKTCDAGLIEQFYRADRAVPLLGDNDFSLAFLFAFFVVVLIAIDEHHNVCILLD